METVFKKRKDDLRISMKERPRLVLQKTSLASLECLALPLVHQVVLHADFQCPKCQERIDDVISRTNEIESVVLNVLDKTMTLTCKYPLVKELPARHFRTLYCRFALLLKLCGVSKR